MENKQQTAVDFLTDCYRRQGRILPAQFEQAKEMEKQQIVKAFNEGTFSEMEKIDAEDYYNQTYGTENSD